MKAPTSVNVGVHGTAAAVGGHREAPAFRNPAGGSEEGSNEEEGISVMNIVKSIGVLGLIGAGTLVGCAASGEDTDVGEGFLNPDDPKTLDDQRNLCDDRVKENGASRTSDIAAGVIRWKC